MANIIFSISRNTIAIPWYIRLGIVRLFDIHNPLIINDYELSENPPSRRNFKASGPSANRPAFVDSRLKVCACSLSIGALSEGPPTHHARETSFDIPPYRRARLWPGGAKWHRCGGAARAAWGDAAGKQKRLPEVAAGGSDRMVTATGGTGSLCRGLRRCAVAELNRIFIPNRIPGLPVRAGKS